MANPKQRHTTERRDRARRELEMKPTQTQECKQCGASVMAHRACPKCGTYRGRVIVKKAAPKLEKKKKSDA